MSLHQYDNPGPSETHTNEHLTETTTFVEFRDGTDHLQLAYTDLDTLDETIVLLLEARANHLAAMCDGRAEAVRVDQLDPDDLAIIDGELVLIEGTVIDGDSVIVRFARKYRGLYDATPSGILSQRVPRSTTCRRLHGAPNLQVV